MKNETEKKPADSVEVAKFCGPHIADGILHGVRKFAIVNRLPLFAGTRCESPAEELIKVLFGESATVYSSPVPSGLSSRIEGALSSSMEEFKKVYEAGELDNLEALCRVVGFGEVLLVLEENRPAIIKLYHEIRGDTPPSKIDGKTLIVPDKKVVAKI